MIKRTCRSTLQAETQAMIYGVEEGTKLRAAIVGARGRQDRLNWEASSARNMKHLWLKDCASLSSHLTSPISVSVEDKRLETDLEGLRQDLWEDLEGNPKDSLDPEDPDKVRWIDTSTMVADPLTKKMKATRLVKTLTSGKLSLEPTPESILQKMSKQKSRKAISEATTTKPEEKKPFTTNRGKKVPDARRDAPKPVVQKGCYPTQLSSA